MMKIILYLILLLSFSSFAGEVTWTAQWVMHPTAEPQAYAVVLFRKSFELPVKPQKFIVHVSADNHYRLFVNGQYILRGPARGDISHWFYETIDLSQYLQAGKNTIAAEVVNWGPKRSFTFFSQMTSFILQGETEAEKMVNSAGGSWKCIQNKAYNPKIVEWMTDRNTIDFGLYVGNPTDSIQEQFIPELSEWNLMKESGMTTFAEVPLEWGEENQRSECHPWSTSPNYFFFRTICGIQPTSPGHKTVEIAPSFGKLTQIKAVYPHYLGNIELDLKRNGTKMEGSVTVPEGIKARFTWGGQIINLKPGKQMVMLYNRI